jgi:hypothetical protein
MIEPPPQWGQFFCSEDYRCRSPSHLGNPQSRAVCVYSSAVRIRAKVPVRLSSKFVSEVLLCLSEIELVDEIIFASPALLKLADQQRV